MLYSEKHATIDLLRRARALIENPDHWSDRDWGDGKPRRCLGHALHTAKGLDLMATPTCELADRALYAVAKWRGASTIGEYNDTHSHAEALDLIDRAIELANRDLT